MPVLRDTSSVILISTSQEGHLFYRGSFQCLLFFLSIGYRFCNIWWRQDNVRLWAVEKDSWRTDLRLQFFATMQLRYNKICLVSEIFWPAFFLVASLVRVQNFHSICLEIWLLPQSLAFGEKNDILSFHLFYTFKILFRRLQQNQFDLF